MQPLRAYVQLADIVMSFVIGVSVYTYTLVLIVKNNKIRNNFLIILFLTEILWGYIIALLNISTPIVIFNYKNSFTRMFQMCYNNVCKPVGLNLIARNIEYYVRLLYYTIYCYQTITIATIAFNRIIFFIK